MMIDLFSGLGGASEPFVQHPDWDVIRVELSEHCSHVPHTIIGDVRDYHVEKSLPSEPDILWMSPPCNEFSTARVPQLENPSMELVDRCLDLVQILWPKYWVIENVRGAIKHFHSRLGPPRVIIDSKICLWGNFPLFTVELKNHSKFHNDTWSDDPLRPQKRAYIPYPVGEALRQSVQYQTSLEHYQNMKP